MYNFCRASKGFFVISVVFIKNLDCKVKKNYLRHDQKVSQKVIGQIERP